MFNLDYQSLAFPGLDARNRKTANTIYYVSAACGSGKTYAVHAYPVNSGRCGKTDGTSSGCAAQRSNAELIDNSLNW